MAAVSDSAYALLSGAKQEWNGSLFRGRHVVRVQAIYEHKAAGAVGYVTPMTVTIRTVWETVSVDDSFR